MDERLTDVSLHDFDHEHMAAMRSTFVESLDLSLAQARSRPSSLATVMSNAASLAGIVNALDGNAAEVQRLVRLIGRAGAALFCVARADGKPLSLCIDSDRPQALSGRVDESRAHVGRWLQAFWAAQAVHDTRALALLAIMPGGVLKRSSSLADGYQFALADAARALAQRDETVTEHLLDALRQTDSRAARVADPDRVLDIDVPTIEVFFALLDADETKMDSALRKAAELHRRYWERGDRRDDPDGMVALPLCGLTSAARSHGLAISVTSGYCPDLLSANAANVTVVACPYCFVPIDDETSTCPGCLEDPRNDAAFETTALAYENAERKRCPHCAAMPLQPAVICPTCRHRQ